MKRTFLAAIAIVVASAAGLAYFGVSSLSAERLRLEQTIRQAHEEGLRPLLYRVEQQFQTLETGFASRLGEVRGLPPMERLAAAGADEPLIDEPYAVDGRRVLTPPLGKGQDQGVVFPHLRFLANKERIQYSTLNLGQQKQQVARINDQNERQQEQSLPQQRRNPQTAQQAGQGSVPWPGQVDQDAQQLIAPNNSVQIAVENPSQWQTRDSTLSEIVRERPSLFIPRFLSDRLELLYWRRVPPPAAPPSEPVRQIVAPMRGEAGDPRGFGFVIDMVAFRARLAELVAAHPPAPDLVAVIRDDKGWRVGANRSGAVPAGAPFIRLDLHRNLPHWELVAHWTRPEAFEALVASRRWTLAALLGGCALALVLGLGLLAVEVRRESVLAAKQADFVSNVSHELKTPLTSIRMYAELLERRFGDEPKIAEYSEVIVSESDRLARLVGQVLDFSRIQHGKQTYDRQPLDLGQLAADVVAEHATRFAPEGVALSLTRPDGPVPVRGDADALAQLLGNLLSNARKYGGEARRIEVAVGGREGHAALEVRDHGDGVPRRWRRRIFEEFVRIDNSLAATTSGSGIGLALAREVARAHAGDLEVTDPPEGPGALFRFTMPTESSQSGDRASPPQAGRQAAAREARVRPRGRPADGPAERSGDGPAGGRQQRGIILEPSGRQAAAREARVRPRGRPAAGSTERSADEPAGGRQQRGDDNA